MSSLAPFVDGRTLLLAANIIPAARIHWPNEPFTQPNPPATWLSFEAFSPQIGLLDIGAKAYREKGSLRIMCLTPAGTGTDSIRALAKQVCNVYRGIGPHNPYYLNAAINEGGTSDDGLWYMLVVSVTFIYDDISS